MKKRIIIIISLLIVLSLGTTYAWFSWNSSNNNVSFTIEGVNIIYNGGNDITGIKLIPVTTKEKGVNDNTAIYKEITVSANKEVNFNLYLDVETLGNGLKDETFVWEIYKGNTLINNGNFKNINVGDTINLMLHEKTSTTTQTYKLYIYIDGSVDNEVTLDNQAYSFKLHADANDNPNEYVVALDADGGNVSNNKILVNKNQTYGTLPTPTREGYTFLGWNGKNMLDTKDVAPLTKNGVTFSANNGVISLSGTNTYSSAYGINSYYTVPTLDSTKNYTLSVSNNISGVYVQINYKKVSTSTQASFISMNIGSLKSKTAAVPSDFDNLMYFFVGIYGTATNVNGQFTIQLEEGSEATAYEPYYITSSTSVVQEKNHTLTAIWE